MEDLEKVAVVIPTYNEAGNIARLIEELKGLYPKVAIFVVDDSSPDSTGAEVLRQSKRFEDINLISRPEKVGLAGAYREAFAEVLKRGRWDWVAEMDADFSHAPADLGRLFGRAEECGLVIGSRYVATGRMKSIFRRRLLSRLGNFYASVVTGTKIRDLTSGFVIYSTRLLEKINVEETKSEGYAFQIEMKCLAKKAGARIAEVPIIFVDRREGKSKMNKGIIFEAILAPWKIRFSRE